MTTALIDGDIVAYRAAAACQHDIDWGDGEGSVTHVDPHQAASAAVQTVAMWAKLAKCKDIVVAFTGRENFRKRVLPTYKANRAGKAKPQAYVHVVRQVTERFETQLIEGLEADDVMGIMATNPKRAGNAVVVTLDKDLRTVPGRHFNPLKDSKPTEVPQAAANWKWLWQTLTGDTTDNYAGCPGIGPKRANAILGTIGRPLAQAWERVVAAFRSKGLTEADALIQARVARILRRGDYDRKTKEVLLWHPETPERLSLSMEASS